MSNTKGEYLRGVCQATVLHDRAFLHLVFHMTAQSSAGASTDINPWSYW